MPHPELCHILPSSISSVQIQISNLATLYTLGYSLYSRIKILADLKSLYCFQDPSRVQNYILKVVFSSTARFSLEILCSTLRFLSASSSLMFRQVCFQNHTSTLEHGVEDPGALPVCLILGWKASCLPLSLCARSSYSQPLTGPAVPSQMGFSHRSSHLPTLLFSVIFCFN